MKGAFILKDFFDNMNGKKIAIIISIAIILFSFLRIILMVGVAGFEPAQSSSQN